MRLTELELDPGGSGEQKCMESLDLFRTKWLGKSDAAHLYTSERFVLISGASEEITRRAAVRLEQIYSAFARYLPPHFNIDQPVTVFLAGQVEDYRKLIGPTAGTILNRAIYLADAQPHHLRERSATTRRRTQFDAKKARPGIGETRSV